MIWHLRSFATIQVSLRRQNTATRRCSAAPESAKDFFDGFAVGFHLAEDHVVVGAAGGHELVVRAALDDAAVFHQQDQVGAADGGEAVGDDERGAAGQERGHRGLDELLAFGVEVAGGFVEDEDLRRGQDRAGDGQPLLLAAGEFDAALADERVVLVGQLDDELVGVGAAGGVFDLGVGGVVAAVGDVVAHRAVEQEHVLLDDGQQVAVGAEAEVADVACR